MIGLVVYVGHDTKLMKNMQRRIFKYSKLEKKMHKIILLILAILFCILLWVAIYYLNLEKSQQYSEGVLSMEFNGTWQFIKVILGYLVLLNTVLPISLIITFQIVKVIQNKTLVLDKWFEDQKETDQVIVNSSNLNDQLGQVQFVLSDKTGTLTQNKMVARYF